MSYYLIDDTEEPSGADPTNRHLMKAPDGKLWVTVVRTPDTLTARYSLDDGVTWSDPETISVEDPDIISYHSLVVDSNSIPHVAWSSGNKLYYSYRDPATGWVAKEEVDSSTCNLPPRLAVDANDDLHMVYDSNIVSTNNHTYYRKRTSGVWGAFEDVHYVVGSSRNTRAIVVDSFGVVHLLFDGVNAPGAILWQPRNVQYAQRTAGGWQAVELVTDMAVDYDQYSADMVLDSSEDVCVLWRGKGWGSYPAYRNVQFRKRESGVWQAEESINDAATTDANPKLSVDSSGRFHCVWMSGIIMWHSQRTDVWSAKESVLSDSKLNKIYGMQWSNYPAGDYNILASYVVTYEWKISSTEYHVKLFVPSVLATVTTQAVTDILGTTATGNGTVTDLGIPDPTQHGHCWSTSPNPTTADDKTELGAKTATGAFTSSLTGLNPGTLYYCRAYATNLVGTSYGADRTFAPALVISRAYALAREEL